MSDSGTKSPMIDAAYVRRLADILAKNDLTEIYIEQDDITLRIAKDAPDVTMVGGGAVAAAPVAAPAAAPAAPAGAAPAADGTADTGDAGPAGTKITAPMVGTAYLQPEPDADKFISVGDQVSEGQTLLIVEAMKTMNAIPSPCSGKVVAILVDDSQPVEFGETLVIIAE
ncbi:MAG: acetyl-CoA carboxylase biotin carboxyl carrier protein [Alphaproteobacteria bacterium]